MPQVLEFNHTDQLAPFRDPWKTLLERTEGGDVSSSRSNGSKPIGGHYGSGQNPACFWSLWTATIPRVFVPLVVRTESMKVGRLRVLTYPLHDWGSFYGPIGPNANATLAGCLGPYSSNSPRLGHFRVAMAGRAGHRLSWRSTNVASGGVPSVYNRLGTAPLLSIWPERGDAYWTSRQPKWLQRFRNAAQRLAKQGGVSYLR